MPLGLTRRRVIVGLTTIVAIAAVASAVALRATKKNEKDIAKVKAPPTLEFTAADLAFVEAKPLARWLPVSGTVQPVHQATVKAKVAGEIREIAVREGQSVKAGQKVARVDTVDLETRLVERMGALDSAKAQLALADKTRTMHGKLLSEKFISQNAADGSESTYNVAQGSVKSAEAQVRLAQSAIKDAAVIAPLSGVVAKRHVQPGEKVAFDAPIVTIVDLREIELAALVPAVDVPEMKIGMPVELGVEGFGERKFTGRIERINPTTEPGTRAFNVYVTLPNADAQLRVGMFATGRIAIAQSAPTPTLPQTAIRTEAGQSFVWTIDNGKLVRRIVVTGRRDDEAGRVEVKTALPANVPVLAARFDNLKEGATAIVKAPGASSNANVAPQGRPQT
ncbi:MAG TPA: efflux RND transporter periplasmic adaptor subunit [Casimicrobiaceae bacterium]|nr:efflux RND transporter periplasmic adaptor subunit [Casimicrobiaceae bacterium]